jgi:hypothetical protein
LNFIFIIKAMKKEGKEPGIKLEAPYTQDFFLQPKR